MTYTSDRPLVVDGVRLDSLAWNIEKINRATAGRRSGDVEVPGRDGVIPSLNDSLEPSMMGLEMFIQGTDSDGVVPPEGKRDRFWANLDELVHLFGKRHALLEVIEQTGPGTHKVNLQPDPPFGATGTANTRAETNLAPNHSAETAGGWLSNNGAVWNVTRDTTVKRSGTQSVKSVLVAGAVNSSVLTLYSVGNLDGNPYSLTGHPGYLSAGVHVQAAQAGYRGQISLAFRDSAGATISTVTSAWVNLTASTWTRLEALNVTIPAGSVTMHFFVAVSTQSGANALETDAAYADDATLTFTRGLSPYFDGATAAADEFTFGWTGTAHASTSFRNYTALPAASATGYGLMLRSTQWAADGTTSLRVVSIHNTGGSAYMDLGQHLEWGKTYTVSATVRTAKAMTTQPQIQAFTVGNTPSMNAVVKADAGLVGSQRISLTFTLPYQSSDGKKYLRLYNANTYWESVWFDALTIVEGTEDPGIFNGGTTQDATYRYIWDGTANASTSQRIPLARRRAWAKVTDSIQPDMNDSGGSGKFTVGLELPYGVWEDEATQDWTGTAGAASGTVQEVTTLRGATERITDAIFLVLGPATNPRVTDPATGAYVELQADLTAADRWRVNVGTWATRTGNIGFTSADTAGTDQQAVTRYGGTANQAAFLPLTPVRLDGTRKVRVALSGTGFTASTQMQVRARRKYAL